MTIAPIYTVYNYSNIDLHKRSSGKWREFCKVDVLEGFIDGKQAVHGDGSFLNFFIAALRALPDIESDAVYGQC
ncbi:hypothetical protein DSJ_19350 [Pantoea stewartii subsp. stewartii DC283]|uniref:Uncharacterized protein n=1 Tax=Pantoea stewartii subsp. stewartii DC283 TaxID=660596 RepID=A0ABN4Z4M9_PANSE|nr:hypothetical protein DSJ_19350 [Pantoea stewartii subsp. stewartii DC283]